MCTGIEIAALAAAVGGAGLQAKSAIDSGSAQRDAATQFSQQQTALMEKQQQTNQAAQAAIAEQQMQQKALSDKANAAATNAITQNSLPAQQQQLQDLTDKRAQAYQTISDLNPVNIDLGSSVNAPSIVGDAISKSIAGAAAKGQQQAKAKAAIEGFGDLTTGDSLGIKSAADNISTFGNLNNISNALAKGQSDYINTSTGLTNDQISNAGSAINNALGVKLARAGNAKAIGDLLFAAGSAGAGAAAAQGGAGFGAATVTKAPTTYGPFYIPPGG